MHYTANWQYGINFEPGQRRAACFTWFTRKLTNLRVLDVSKKQIAKTVLSGSMSSTSYRFSGSQFRLLCEWVRKEMKLSCETGGARRHTKRPKKRKELLLQSDNFVSRMYREIAKPLKSRPFCFPSSRCCRTTTVRRVRKRRERSPDDASQ